MSSVPGTIREKAKEKLATKLASCNAKPSPGHTVAAAVEAIEAALFKNKLDTASYREQLLAIIGNVPNIASEISLFDPNDLAVLTPTEILTRRQAARRDEERNDRNHATKLPDEDNVMCVECGLPQRHKMNLNRFGLDDEVEGTQFDNNFENLCQCELADSDVEAEEPNSAQDITVANPPQDSVPRKKAQAKRQRTTETERDSSP
jgi:hypothetical protein